MKKVIKTGEIKESIFGCFDEDTGEIETKGGRIYCRNCYSIKGIRARNYYRKDNLGNDFLKLFKRCGSCGSLEITNNWTGEILKQERNIEQYEKYKTNFLRYIELLKKKI